MAQGYLAKKNSHPRDESITFDEGPHIYTINGNSDFTSVTTFCHALFKEFDAEGILDKIFSRKPVKEKYRDETRESLKAKWEKNRVEAADALLGRQRAEAPCIWPRRAACISRGWAV